MYFSQLCHDKLPKNDSAQYIYIYIYVYIYKFMPFIFNIVKLFIGCFFYKSSKM